MNFLKNNFIVFAITAFLFVPSTLAFAQEQGAGNVGVDEELLYVDVTWDRSSIVADSDSSSVLFSSDGKIFRSKAETIHLSVTSLTDTTPLRVCSFPPNAGRSFDVSYPSCATGRQNINQTISGGPVFLPNNSYYVSFTDDFGNIINSPNGDATYLLPTLQGPALANNLISASSKVLPHSDGGKYYSIDITINETIPSETFQFFLRTLNSAAYVQPEIGILPITKGTYTLPAAEPAQGLANGTYELVAVYRNLAYEVINLDPRISDDRDDQNAYSGDSVAVGGIFSSSQLAIMSGGLVPDCGYDIQTLSNKTGSGRACGLNDLILLIQKLIEYVFILILPIAAVVVAYVGYLYLTSGGNTDKRKKAKKAITSLITGVVVILSAWLMVKTILNTLGVKTEISEQFLDLNT